MRSTDRKLGRRFADARRTSKLTQEQVAESVGVTPETIGRLERGEHIPALARLEQIARVEGVELADLLRPAERVGKHERAIARLVAMLRRRAPEDAELAVDLLERIFRRWP